MHENAKKRLVAMGSRPKGWQDARRETFESLLISQFMREIKLPSSHRKLVDTAAAHHGSLHLGAFNEALPEFPFSLAFHTGEKLKELSAMDAFFKPRKIERVCTLFAEAIEGNFLSDDKPTLLLLKFAYLDSLMTMHNTVDNPVEPGLSQLRITTKDGSTLVLEPVAAIRIRFADYLASYYGQAM